MSVFKKAVILGILTVVLSGCFGGYLKKTEAAMPVTSTEVASVPTTVQIVKDIGQWLKEDLVKALRDVIAKRLIDYIVDETVKWVQGGGEPKFVSDWKGFVKDAGDIAFDSVAKETGLARLCEPLKMPTLNIVLLPTKRFSQRIDCTLDKIVSNINNFYKDFQSGGWFAYSESWQPNNNLYGQLLIIDDEITLRKGVETTAAKSEAAAGSGFLSVKKCAEMDFAAAEVDMEIMRTEAGYTEQDIADYMSQNYNEKNYCKKWETQTPGDAVGKTVASALTSDKEWAGNIQSWIATLINAAINRLTTEGLLAMKSAISGQPQRYYPPEYSGLRSGEISGQQIQSTDDLGKFMEEWRYISDKKKLALNAAQKTKDIYLNYRSGGCLPEIPDAMINLNFDTIANLNNDIKTLEKQISDAEDIKNKLISAADTPEAQYAAQQAYSKFSDSNTSVREKIITGDNRKAADEEVQTQNLALQYAQTKYVCVINQTTSTSTTPQ
ncbi:MAG: hypothetical protein QMD86_01550 [Patescibacteria group bacterium]|nr:hypothetical protein [Patescibacteria group bacterium]